MQLFMSLCKRASDHYELFTRDEIREGIWAVVHKSMLISFAELSDRLDAGEEVEIIILSKGQYIHETGTTGTSLDYR